MGKAAAAAAAAAARRSKLAADFLAAEKEKKKAVGKKECAEEGSTSPKRNIGAAGRGSPRQLKPLDAMAAHMDETLAGGGVKAAKALSSKASSPNALARMEPASFLSSHHGAAAVGSGSRAVLALRGC